MEKIIEINSNAVKRGSKLVQQILTFARKTEVQFIPLNLNIIIQDLIKMLDETFPRTIRIVLNLTPQLPYISGDQSQINQVLMNLCVNSRDAMPEGGTISISTCVAMGWDVKKKYSDANSDCYIQITITDTGHGMDENIRHRIFEPFFTTKESGKGTGLGLAVVYGIISYHRGYIDVASDIGVGTTFSIYLPVSLDGQIQIEQSDEIDIELLKGTETLLVVEDEEVLLQSFSALLTNSGYNVIQAKDGYEAVESYKKNKKDIDLVIMDIELPKLNGWDALAQMKIEDNELKAIISSGYLDPKIKSEKMVEGICDFIHKPYDPPLILKSIRKVLDANKS
ncbi:MAG: response regulator [Ignavibacteriales bacterium]|nr:response regulator [Ignavibacteriales bacterium]